MGLLAAALLLITPPRPTTAARKVWLEFMHCTDTGCLHACRDSAQPPLRLGRKTFLGVGLQRQAVPPPTAPPLEPSVLSPLWAPGTPAHQYVPRHMTDTRRRLHLYSEQRKVFSDLICANMVCLCVQWGGVLALECSRN